MDPYWLMLNKTFCVTRFPRRLAHLSACRSSMNGHASTCISRTCSRAPPQNTLSVITVMIMLAK